MYGACHAKLHARAMARVGGANSEGGRQKTPDFGLGEDEGSLHKQEINDNSHPARPQPPNAT